MKLKDSERMKREMVGFAFQPQEQKLRFMEGNISLLQASLAHGNSKTSLFSRKGASVSGEQAEARVPDVRANPLVVIRKLKK